MRYAIVFIEVLRHDQNWVKKTDFLAHFERFFVYHPPPISPTKYAKDFAK